MLPACAPAAAAGLAAVRAAPGPEGTFQALLAGLVVAAAVGAFLAPRPGRAAVVLPVLALLLGGVPLARTGDLPAALATAALAGGVALAAWGLRVLGRAAATPALPAATIAFAVLCAAMLAISWGDRVAGHVPRPARHGFRQAVVLLDPALALAYDGAHFDRLRSPAVYARLDLASALLERPRAEATALLWGGLGVLAAAAGLGLAPRRRERVGAGALSGGEGEGDAGAHQPPHAPESRLST